LRIFINALIATIGVGLVLVGLFAWWQEKSLPSQGRDKVQLLNHLEGEGMLDFKAKLISGAVGEFAELSQFRGKKIILSFWASWCGPCVDEFPSMLNLVNQLNGDAILVAVSADSNRESIEEFLTLFPNVKTNSNVVILWDEDLSVGKLYQADRLPESYVIGSNFKLVRKVSGAIKWDTEEAIAFVKNIQ
jgi:thiol-disulfide isomerase/thioredoxin